MIDLKSYAYIYDGGRSPFGRLGGALSAGRPDDMLAQVIKKLIGRNAFDLKLYEDMIVGSTNQAGADSRNVARFAGLLAGLPIEVGGITVNRLCGSSLAATLDAARAGIRRYHNGRTLYQSKDHQSIWRSLNA